MGPDRRPSGWPAHLIDEIDVAVVATNQLGRVTHWSRGAAALFGWSAEQAIGRRLAKLALAPEQRDADLAIRSELGRRGHWEGELELRRRDGGRFVASGRVTLHRDESGQPAGAVGVWTDISGHVTAERELREARDYLRAVTDSMGEGLCTLDVDGRVTYVNRAAQRMLGWSLEDLGGRSLHELAHRHGAGGSPFSAAQCPIRRARAERVVMRVEEDVFTRRDGSQLPVAYTVAPFDTAESGGSVIVFTDVTERKAQRERMVAELEAVAQVRAIREALDDDRFMLHAQPIVDVASGRTVQHELLLRMVDRGGETIAPASFLPAAEEYGLIREIDRWVIARAADLAGDGHPVELNLSAESLGDPRLFERFESELARSGARPADLAIELTETALLKEEALARAFIERVKALGCRVGLDDFGTGYGGFTYLKQLPVDYLKLDMEFIRDLKTNPASRHVVEAIVRLARGFGQTTVAEGVEDAETLSALSEMGVDFVQGYHLGHPAPLGVALGGPAAG